MIDILLQGLLLGGLYALFALGQSLMFGVMRIVNLAHGVLAMLAAYLGFVLVNNIGLPWVVGLVLVMAGLVAQSLAQEDAEEATTPASPA